MARKKIMLKPKLPSTYELREPLGEGLSSRVIAAIRRDGDGLTEQSVVLKILKSETAVSWLQKEFAALRAVDSPYCVRVLAWENFSEGPALVLERIEGVTLFELGRKFQLTDNEIDEIAHQVVRGLRDLHAAGVKHGDLSPRNVLINRSGEVKLIDFGASGIEFVGTRAYVSHSRWQNPEAAQTHADDFAAWSLIDADLRSRFNNTPTDEALARQRAADFEGRDTHVLRSASQSADRDRIAEKVAHLLDDALATTQLTAVLAAPSKSLRAWGLKELAAVLLLAISTPVFSSPETQRVGFGSVQISTMKWVEISIDAGPRRYSPLKARLGAGRHRLRWRSQRGSGSLDVTVTADQTQTLSDLNFRH